MENKFFDELREKIQLYFEKGGSHEFSHTERVYNLALEISEGEKVDMDIIKTAALLHDIARYREDKGEVGCHAETGAELAKEILEKTDFPKEKIEKVCHAISVHRYSKKLRAESREAEILQDADRLDALGAITIARVFMHNGKRGNKLYDANIEPEKEYHGQETTAINHFYEKILKIKPETFSTKRAREIAKERYSFVEEFLNQFKAEWEGKR